jgi:hypothetical protein
VTDGLVLVAAWGQLLLFVVVLILLVSRPTRR